MIKDSSPKLNVEQDDASEPKEGQGCTVEELGQALFILKEEYKRWRIEGGGISTGWELSVDGLSIKFGQRLGNAAYVVVLRFLTHKHRRKQWKNNRKGVIREGDKLEEWSWKPRPVSAFR